VHRILLGLLDPMRFATGTKEHGIHNESHVHLEKKGNLQNGQERTVA
jgi:hypothetical protein